MALVCHDQYDHPLLWCEERRRTEERRIANESLATIEQQRKEAELQKRREANEVSALHSIHYVFLISFDVRHVSKTVSQNELSGEKIKLDAATI